MNSFPPKDRVCSRTIGSRKPLQFIDPNAAFSLLDRNNRRSCGVDNPARLFLREFCNLSRKAKPFADFNIRKSFRIPNH
jgi:hypothetical protein